MTTTVTYDMTVMGLSSYPELSPRTFVGESLLAVFDGEPSHLNRIAIKRPGINIYLCMSILLFCGRL